MGTDPHCGRNKLIFVSAEFALARVAGLWIVALAANPLVRRLRRPVTGRLIPGHGACKSRHKNGILLTAKSVNKLSGSANERFDYKT